MFETIVILKQFLPFAAPPLIGAFIGYLTNKVAIRMLFRPLKRWKVGPFRVPMTPGVIPSKRHDLAVNIGEMVGEHLLTSSEISNSLLTDKFQDHLQTLIEGRVGTLLKMDLGPIPALIPEGYRNYYEIAKKTLVFRLQDLIHRYLRSEASQQAAARSLRQWLASIGDRSCSEVFDGRRRSELYEVLARGLGELISGPRMQQLISSYLDQAVSDTVAEGRSTKDILPGALVDIIIDCVGNQSPQVVEKASELLRDPEIQNKIVQTAHGAINDFIGSYGPMASMIQSFVDQDKIEGRLRKFLEDPDNEIVTLLRDPAVQGKVETALRERASTLMDQPLKQTLGDTDEERIEDFCRQVGQAVDGLLASLRDNREIRRVLEHQLEPLFQDGSLTLGTALERLFGRDCLESGGTWLEAEIRQVFSSAELAAFIDRLVEGLVERLLSRPVGRLGDLVPAGVREGLSRSLQEVVTTMLVSEVPGIVKSLDIRKIVTNRIDSFDLLRLERLLLSIMAEQFKYINLFGAILGFLIGCINLVLMTTFR